MVWSSPRLEARWHLSVEGVPGQQVVWLDGVQGWLYARRVGGVVSEPTYRVELTHHPENGEFVSWKASLYLIASEHCVTSFYRAGREEAFDAVQKFVRGLIQEPERPSTVLLTEDGDILDPHEVQR